MAVLRSASLALLAMVAVWGTVTPEGVDESHTPDRDAYRLIAGSNRNFSNSLYELLSHTEGNVFFSPLSIQTVLALAAQGARGATLAEMISGLHLPQDQQTTRDGFRQLLKLLKINDAETVKIANKIYTDRRYPPTAEFLQIALTSFNSDAEKVNFSKSEEVRQSINGWVEENTGNKIRNLIAEGSLSRSTVMVLVNAVYFKGSWVTQFNPDNTKPMMFHVSETVQKEVQMMHVKVRDNFSYKESEELGAKILEIPYVGHTISLVIILPNERGDLHNVESKLANMDLRHLFKNMLTPEIHVKLPKFKLEKSIELNDVLAQLGMGQMFSDSADFSALTSQGPIKVSKVVHKAFIDVNEEGAEAAASTAAVTQHKRARRRHIDFNVNHPFLFALCYSGANADVGGMDKAVLFMGRYSEP